MRMNLFITYILAIMIVANPFILSDYGDSLVAYWKLNDLSLDDNFNDNSINTNRWNSFADNAGFTVSESNNKINLAQVSGTSNWTGSGLASDYKMSGDFDIQVSYSNLVKSNPVPSDGGLYLALYNNDSNMWADETIIVRRNYNTNNQYDGGFRIDGVWQSVLSQSSGGATSGDLRIARTGNTVNLYYRNNPTDVWTSLNTMTNTQLGQDMTMKIMQTTYNGVTGNSCSFDNFNVINGEKVISAVGSSTGTIYGATQTTSQTGYGTALNFNGTSDYIKVNDSNSLSFGNSISDTPLTFSAWIKPNDATHARVFAKSDYAGNDEYRFMINGNDKLTLILYDGNASNYITRNSTATLSSYEGSWVNIMATYDGSGSANGIKLYLNGTEIASDAATAGSYIAMHNTNRYLEIGSTIANSWYLNGSLDDPSIWNRKLDANEVASLYELGTEKFEGLSTALNNTNKLNLAYTTSEIKQLADIYTNMSGSIIIDGLLWTYIDHNNTIWDMYGTRSVGETFMVGGVQYLYLGGGLSATAIPELSSWILIGIVAVFFILHDFRLNRNFFA